MPEGNEYIYLKKFMGMEEVDRKLEGIARESRRYHPVTGSLSKSSRRNWNRLCRIAVWKTRKSKFKRYYHNIVSYFIKHEEETKETI